jgi:hypothetical protein
MIEKYSLHNIIKEWKNNKDLHSYIRGQKIEKYKNHMDDDYDYEDIDSSCKKVMGLELNLFILISLLVIIIWGFAIWSIWRYWNVLPEWAKIVGLITLLSPNSGGPLITLLVVYFSKEDKEIAK